jgi:hypothetical protein
MAFIGVLISWLMVERNRSLAWLACSASSFALRSSSRSDAIRTMPIGCWTWLTGIPYLRQLLPFRHRGSQPQKCPDTFLLPDREDEQMRLFVIFFRIPYEGIVEPEISKIFLLSC